MMSMDFSTVLWKEWKEIVMERSAGGAGSYRPLILIAALGILVPLRMGPERFFQASQLLIYAFFSAVVITAVIADSFAGERERHTLETLLASRLSDRAILFGKVSAAVAYGTAAGLIGALVQAVVANLSPKNADAGLAFYPVGSIVAIIVLALLMSLLTASVGCLVSLRAATTRQAQLSLTFGFLALVFAPFIIFQVLPRQTQDALLAALNSADPLRVFLIFSGVLLTA